MPFIKLALQPGIDKQNTEYGAEGGWIDSDYVRFRYGLPEKMGGWTHFNGTESSLVGQLSDLFSWNALDGSPYLAAGTTKKLYIFNGNTFYDITPLRETTDPGDVTFSATDGSPIIEVAHTGHGAVEGDFVTFEDAVGLGGNITAEILNSEFEIQTIVNLNSYTIVSPVAADSSDVGDGGASTVGTYQINVGSDVDFFDFGDKKFAAFFACLLTDVIIVHIEDVEFFTLLIFEPAPGTDSVEGGIPACARTVRGGRKPKSTRIFQLILFGIIVNGGEFSFFLSVIPSDSD
jgi:hypothetical protein